MPTTSRTASARVRLSSRCSRRPRRRSNKYFIEPSFSLANTTTRWLDGSTARLSPPALRPLLLSSIPRSHHLCTHALTLTTSQRSATRYQFSHHRFYAIAYFYLWKQAIPPSTQATSIHVTFIGSASARERGDREREEERELAAV